MAGATNRQFKTAGIPRAAVDKIRVKAGGRLTLKGALGVATQHGIPVPEKAHAFLATRDEKARKVAPQQASAHRGKKLTRALADASKATMARRKTAASLDASRVTTQGHAVNPDKFKSGDMKPGDRLHVGAANISKVVSKHTRRNSNGMGRYSVSSTTYIIRVGKKQVESVGDFRAAIAAAKTHGGNGPTRLVKLADRDDA